MATQPGTIPAITSATPLSTRGQPMLPGSNSRTSAAWPMVVPPGQTITLQAGGNTFYLVSANVSVNIRPDQGVFSAYVQGTGKNCDFFSYLEVNNPGAQPAVLSLFVGWQDFIDNRLIISAASNSSVVFQTRPNQLIPNDAIDINDKIGQAFASGGKSWLAVARTAVLVFNTDPATVLYLIAKPNDLYTVATTIAVIPPQTALRYDAGGDMALVWSGVAPAPTKPPGWNPALPYFPAIVSEIYQAIPNTRSV